MLKKKRTAKSGGYLLIFVILCAFVFAVVVAVLPFMRAPADTDDRDNDASVDAAFTQQPAATDDADATDTPDINDGIFTVSDSDALYELVSSGRLNEYYKLHGDEPVVVVNADIMLDRELIINGGVTLILSGAIERADGVMITIKAEGRRTITITTNESIDLFRIDAPESALYIEGGDVPFSYEVAKRMNVASYNGTSMEGAADGDTLGGTGRGTALGVTLFSDKKKTTPQDGVYSEVDGNIITLYIPHTVSDKALRSAYIDVLTDGGECADVSGALDLTSSVLLDVTDGEGRSRTYRLTAKRIDAGIPILSIYTDDGKAISSKTDYKSAVMTLDGVEYTLSIRGRGNASWRIFPKHSYRIKLDAKAKLLGMTADRDWCLIGNYADPSLVRNIVASDMAKAMSHLYFTPSYRSVDLFINGEYVGVYMLSEKIEADDDRVPLGGETVYTSDGKIQDMGFLIEFGWDYFSENVWAKDYFDTTYCKRMYIKEPVIEKAKNAQYKYIYNYIKSAEDAIVKGGDYEEWIDVDSWVDWFIVNEFTNNTECAFYRSLYMYKPVGGKLTAGPIWDYDMAFGNSIIDRRNYDGWACVDFVANDMTDNWMKFLIKDEKFMSKVRARWAEMKGTLYSTAMASLERSAGEIEVAQEYNFIRWDKVLKVSVGQSRASRQGFKTWQEHIDYIRDFIDMRYKWIDDKLSVE